MRTKVNLVGALTVRYKPSCITIKILEDWFCESSGYHEFRGRSRWREDHRGRAATRCSVQTAVRLADVGDILETLASSGIGFWRRQRKRAVPHVATAGNTSDPCEEFPVAQTFRTDFLALIAVRKTSVTLESTSPAVPAFLHDLNAGNAVVAKQSCPYEAAISISSSLYRRTTSEVRQRFLGTPTLAGMGLVWDTRNCVVPARLGHLQKL